MTKSAVEKFVSDTSAIGRSDFSVATTSGTTGTRGLFLIDSGALGVASAMGARMLGNWLGPQDVLRIIAGRGRIAMVSATGGHFASAAAAANFAAAAGPSPVTAEIRCRPYECRDAVPTFCGSPRRTVQS